MNLGALTVDELLRFEPQDSIAVELAGRLRADDLFTRDQVDEIRDLEYTRGSNDSMPEAIDFIYRLMDGEVWRDHLEEEVRDWIKADLLMLLDPLDDEESIETRLRDLNVIY